MDKECYYCKDMTDGTQMIGDVCVCMKPECMDRGLRGIRTGEEKSPMKMEIINPSDECYLENDDLEASAMMVAIISDGKYALNDMVGNELMPLFMFGDDGAIEKFWQEKFGHSLDDFANSEGVRKRLADVCDSFSYGVKGRSSLNDIGDAFKSYGDEMRKVMEEEESA